MAKIGTSVSEIRIEPRTYSKIDIMFDIDNSDIYDLIECMIKFLSNNEKQDLFDKLKGEGYGN